MVLPWLLGLAAGVALALTLLWLRARRIRLQVEADYLSAVADFAQEPARHGMQARFGDVRGELPRRLVTALVGRGVGLGPLVIHASGRLRYDSDDRDRPVSAESFLLPCGGWAQIRRVGLRRFGWIVEIHRVDGRGISSSYWWLGLFRIECPGCGPSPLALRAQALGERALAPWCWFVDRGVQWQVIEEGSAWEGVLPETGSRVTLDFDSMQRPRAIGLHDPETGATVCVELGDWRWIERALTPTRISVIEGAGSANEFRRLDLQIHDVQRAPGFPLAAR
ncbi:hypothetical protein [Thioalkalivibrio paradoxus]|uniref:hypothetical protein n=1 Tax=Thioalkalivibrio paradoxus TaxID=108010 RepID=UPI00022C2C24|nr:hypothetical protein [Thioalkalivibrio paradoxus]